MLLQTLPGQEGMSSIFIFKKSPSDDFLQVFTSRDNKEIDLSEFWTDCTVRKKSREMIETKASAPGAIVTSLLHYSKVM